MLGMSPREPFALAAFGEFFEPVRAHRVEQPIARDGAARHQSDERLRDQIGDAAHDFRWRDLGARNNRAGHFQAEAPANTARRRRITRSGSLSSS